MIVFIKFLNFYKTIYQIKKLKDVLKIERPKILIAKQVALKKSTIKTLILNS